MPADVITELLRLRDEVSELNDPRADDLAAQVLTAANRLVVDQPA